MKTDLELKTAVAAELHWEPTVTSDDIHVAATQGVVTLSGSVPYYAEKQAAERATRRVLGVRAIAEELQVHRLQSHDHPDTDIAVATANALKWHVWVPDKVQATVESGWVTLTGEVKWEYQRSAAADAVSYLSGVRGVLNQIAIKPSVEPTAVRKAIENALKRDAQIDADNIKVATSGGKVTLSGRTRSWNERDGAGWAAWSAPSQERIGCHPVARSL